MSSPTTDQQNPGVQVDPSLPPNDQLMQGLKNGGTPILAPDGTSGFVHADHVNDFLKSNPTYKRATIMTAPNGTPGMVSLDEADKFLKDNPDYKLGQPITKDETVQGPGVGERALSWLNKGLVNGEEFFKTFASHPELMTPHIARGLGVGPKPGDVPEINPREIANRPPSLNETPFEAGARSFVGNMESEGAKTAADFTTSPLAIATSAAGPVAESTGALGKLARAATKGASLGFAGSGAAHVAHAALDSEGSPADRLEEGLQGASQVLMGGAHAPGTLDTARETGELVKSGGEVVKNATTGAVDKLRKAYDPSALTAEESATKAFRPRNSKSKWNDEIASALPDARRAADSLGINSNEMTLDDALHAVQRAKQDVWSEYEGNHLAPNQHVAVPTDSVASRIRDSISDRVREQNPGYAEKIENIADTYQGRDLSLADINRRVAELNNETRGIEAKYVTDKRAAKLDPSNAPVFAERDALRQLLLDKLNELSGEGAADLRKRWGALNSVEDVISRRIPVADRAAREPLQAVLAKVYAAGHIISGVASGNPISVLKGAAALAAERRARALNNPEYLTQQAFNKTTPREAPPVTGEYLNESDLPASTQPEQRALPPGQYEQPASPLGPILAKGRPRLQAPERVPVNRQLPESTEGASFELPEANPEAPVSRYVAGRGENPVAPFLRAGKRATLPQETPGAPEPRTLDQTTQAAPIAPQEPSAESPTQPATEPEEQAPGLFGQDQAPAPKYVGRESPVRLISPKELNVDPARFQWRNVPRASIPESAPWDQTKAGPIDVWRDPQDGKLYVVEGHHRFNHAMRTNTPEIEVRQHEFDNAQSAKDFGALRNIELGNATPFDAAMYMRNNGLKVADLQNKGINLTGDVPQKASALANLSPAMWEKYRSGDLDEAKAGAIGANLDDPAQQAAMADLSKKQRLSAGELDQLARRIKEQGNTSQSSMGLFGEQEDSQSNAIGTARIAMKVEKALQTDKAALKFISNASEARKAALERGKNIIDTDASGQEAMIASALAEQFRRSQNRKGVVSDLLDEAGRRVTKGDKPDAVFKDIYPQVRKAVLDELGGTTNELGPGPQGPGPGSGGRSSSGGGEQSPEGDAGKSSGSIDLESPEPPEPPSSVREIMDKYEKQGVDSWISEGKDGVIELSRIVVPKDQRNQGIGTQFMSDLTDYADRTGKTIALTPAKDFGATSVGRLKDFYKRFGFKKNKDSRISESMTREPRVDLESPAPEQRRAQLDNPNFRNWFGESKVADEDGTPQVVYRGDYRGDKIGNTFKVNKSTSGRFYFTEDPEIASKYATGKEDINHNWENQDFEHWYRFPDYKYKGERTDPNLSQVWYRLSPEEKARVKDVVENTSMHDNGDFHFDAGHSIYPNSDLPRLLQEQHGNWLNVAKDIWLSSGNLHGYEGDFTDILEKAGIKNPVYDNPHDPHSAVTPVYLSVKNPLDTEAIPQNVVDALNRMAKSDRSRRAEYGVDVWDKNTITPREWVDEFNNSVNEFKRNYPDESGTARYLRKDFPQGSVDLSQSHVWTRVPEKVTKLLQEMGYDGIKDTGGKLGGAAHKVWIAFEPNQIKSAVGNKGTFDPESDNILKSQGGDDLITGRSPEAENKIASDAKFSVEDPGQGLPKYVRADRNAMQLISKATGRPFRGVNMDPENARNMVESLRDSAENYGPGAKQNILELADQLEDNINDRDGLNIVGAMGSKAQEIDTLHEELFHSAGQRRPGEGDIEKGVPVDAVKDDPGMQQQIAAVKREIGDRHPVQLTAEAMFDIVSGEHDLEPEVAHTTATKFWNALPTETLGDVEKLNSFIDDLRRKHGIIQQPGGAHEPARQALANVLAQRRGEGTGPARTEVSAEPNTADARPGNQAGPKSNDLPSFLRPANRRSPAAPRQADEGSLDRGTDEPVSGQRNIGLSDDELSQWSKSKGFRYEQAGEQQGMFGDNEPIYRVYRTVGGKEQRGLVYKSQLDALNKPAEQEPAGPFGLQGGEGPREEQPHLFGAGDMGEIIGSRQSSVPSFLRSSKSSPGQGSLFRKLARAGRR
jgi:hypothetical protein